MEWAPCGAFGLQEHPCCHIQTATRHYCKVCLNAHYRHEDHGGLIEAQKFMLPGHLKIMGHYRIVPSYATARCHGLISPEQKPQAYLLSFILSRQYASNLSHQYHQPTRLWEQREGGQLRWYRSWCSLFFLKLGRGENQDPGLCFRKEPDSDWQS